MLMNKQVNMYISASLCNLENVLKTLFKILSRLKIGDIFENSDDIISCEDQYFPLNVCVCAFAH